MQMYNKVNFICERVGHSLHEKLEVNVGIKIIRFLIGVRIVVKSKTYTSIKIKLRCSMF